MAKSSRSSTKKANNQRKAANIFGPAESARAERLSARLLELAKQPKPEAPEMSVDAEEDAAAKNEDAQAEANENSMDVDSGKPSKVLIDRKRVDKKRQKKSGIVFKKYSDRQAASKKKKATK